MGIDVEKLKQIPFFTPLGYDDLSRIASMTLERRYERGDIILLEGEKGGALHYVHSGLVKVFKTSVEGREQILHLFAAGTTFNDVPALDGGPNPASAAAMEPSVVYIIRRSELMTLIRTQPAVAEAIVQRLASALRHLVGLAEDLSLRHVTARVAKILLDRQVAFQENPTSHRLTQQEIAALAGTAREVVGRSLKALEAAGAIEVRQGRVIVTDSERLAMLIAGASMGREP